MTSDSTPFTEFHAMASPCRIRVAGVAPEVAARAMSAAVAEVQRIEAKYSRYRPDSVLSRINAEAGSGEPVAVDEETGDLFGFADELHGASDGLFDITSGVLRRAWDFKARRVPTAAELADLCARIGWERVTWSREAIALPEAGMEIDLGGLGKEYACDRAASVLMAHGVSRGLVNLGGDLRVLGPQVDEQPWHLGIAHPRDEGATIASVDISQGALATSGDYERYFEADGRRYCHILNPRTGWPVAYWQSVSVLAPSCLAAGALATVGMLKQAEACDFLRDEGASFLVIDPLGQILRESAPA